MQGPGAACAGVATLPAFLPTLVAPPACCCPTPVPGPHLRPFCCQTLREGTRPQTAGVLPGEEVWGWADQRAGSSGGRVNPNCFHPPAGKHFPWVEKNTSSRDKKRGAQHQWGDHVPHAGIPGGLSDLHSRFWSWEGVEGLIITLLSSTGSPGLARGAGCCFHTGWVPPAWVGITGAIVLGTWWIQRGWKE